EAGADGYTLKDISVQELASTIQRLAGGDTVLHPDAASSLARRFSSNGKGKAVPLTPRQREILRLIAAGLENKQIARRLGTGVHTVKTHVSRVLNKLGASSRTDAVVLALRARLISEYGRLRERRVQPRLRPDTVRQTRQRSRAHTSGRSSGRA